MRNRILSALAALVDYDSKTGSITWAIAIGGRSKKGSEAGGMDFAGYQVICFLGRRIKTHRLAWFIYYGEEPPAIIDHINGDRSDNRICNLRKSSAQENALNRKEHRNGQKYGVTFRKDTKKWTAQFWIKKKKFYLGQFDSEEEAHQAYLEGKAS